MSETVFLIGLLASVLLVMFPVPSSASRDDEIPSKVLKSTKNYEFRSYPAANWLCKNYTGEEIGVRNVAASFFVLYDYARGENSEGVALPVMVPVTLQATLSINENEENLYQMCFYLPEKHQKNPPKPLNEAVFIYSRQSFTVAVRKFNAFFLTISEFHRQTEHLVRDLLIAKESMDYSHFFGAVYDPPFTVNARLNEVWILRKEQMK